MIRVGMAAFASAYVCLALTGCAASDLQSFNNGLAQFNSTLNGAPRGTNNAEKASQQGAGAQLAADPRRIGSLDEILKAYADSGHSYGGATMFVCGDRGPIDVSDFVKRANALAKTGDDTGASANLRIAAEVVARQATENHPCVLPSQAYSPVGQFLALSVIEEKNSRLMSSGIRQDAYNALQLLQSDPVSNKATINSLVATGLVKGKSATQGKPKS